MIRWLKRHNPFARWHSHAMWDGRGMVHRHVVIGSHPIEYRQAHPEAPL